MPKSNIDPYKKEVSRIKSKVGVINRLRRLAGKLPSPLEDAINSPYASPESIALALSEEKSFLRLQRELAGEREKLGKEDSNPPERRQPIRYSRGLTAKIKAGARIDAVEAGYRATNSDPHKAALVKRAIDISHLETHKDWAWKNATVSEGIDRNLHKHSSSELPIAEILLLPPYDLTHLRPSQPGERLNPATLPDERARLEKTPVLFAQREPHLNSDSAVKENEILVDNANAAGLINQGKDLPPISLLQVPPIPTEISTSRIDTDLEIERARYNRSSEDRLALKSRTRDRSTGRVF